jgi:hypothetical protein
MLEELLNQEVVIDLRSPFVCLGILARIDEQFLELANADFHDLRDSQTNRENYVASVRTSEIIPNRKKVLLARSEVIAVSRLKDVLAG